MNSTVFVEYICHSLMTVNSTNNVAQSRLLNDTDGLTSVARQQSPPFQLCEDIVLPSVLSETCNVLTIRQEQPNIKLEASQSIKQRSYVLENGMHNLGCNVTIFSNHVARSLPLSRDATQQNGTATLQASYRDLHCQLGIMEDPFAAVAVHTLPTIMRELGNDR